MKQKMVIKVYMDNSQKARTKALKIAVGVPGVESASLVGKDKSLILVTGDGVDAIALTSLLRKKMGLADLISLIPLLGDYSTEQDSADNYNLQNNHYSGGGIGLDGEEAKVLVRRPLPPVWSPYYGRPNVMPPYYTYNDDGSNTTGTIVPYQYQYQYHAPSPCSIQ